MELGISIIICCYNSAQRLPGTLKHLAMQQVPANINWEIIVVNNASTDDTTAIAQQEWAKYNLQTNFQILQQTLPGKNHAFDKGIEAAHYSYILTCDDDNWLHPDYVNIAFEIMKADPMIGALGGYGILEPEQPAWSKIAQFETSYINGPQTYAETDHWVYGAGSVYRKSAIIGLQEAGWQKITTGRLGKKLICGEDVEYCFIIYLAGYKIIADDRLTFKHFVPLKRQNETYIFNLIYWQAYSYVLLSSYHMLIDNDKRTMQQKLKAWLMLSFKALILHSISTLKKKPVKDPIEKIRQKGKWLSYYGTIIAIIQNRKKLIRHFEHTKATLIKLKAQNL